MGSGVVQVKKMTIGYITDGHYTGLSTDTKPAAAVGHTIYETDTGDTLVADGFYWWVKSLGPWTNRKWGYAGMGSSITTGMGSLASMSGATGAGSQAIGIDSTYGKYFICITNATIGNKGGIRSSGSVAFRLTNPKLRIRFKCVDLANMRLYLGITAVQELTGDTPLDAGAHGVIFGFRSTDTNFTILHNDSTGTATVVDTGVAKNTAIHDFRLVAQDSVPRYSWSLDGARIHI